MRTKNIYLRGLIRHQLKNQSGFTLLELILSLSIVAIIVALGLGGVRLGISARDVGEQKVDTYQRLRIISEQLKQKLQSTYPVFVSQIDGVPGVFTPASSKRILAFEGNSDSIRFVTFATPMTASDSTTSTHEVKFYIGEHPETGQTLEPFEDVLIDVDEEFSGAVVEAMLADLDAAHPGRDMLTRMIHVEMKLRLGELLLMRLDKITMSNSVEGRVPFLDQGLVEFTMDIPEAWKGRGGTKKHLLKKALEGVLPAEIIHRPKMGFGAPMAEWLRSGFGHEAEAGVMNSKLPAEFGFDRDQIRALFRDHRDGRRDNALHLWTLFNLTAWHDHWINGKAV